MKCKVFQTTADKLEEEVNDWLKSEESKHIGQSAKIDHVCQTTTAGTLEGGEQITYVTLTIFYR